MPSHGINYGLVPLNLFSYHELDDFYSINQVPWSHGREEVPLWLANYGVTLNNWQEWVDRGTSLWLERNEVLRKLIKLGSTYTWLGFSTISLMIISPYLPETSVFFACQLFLFFFMMFLLVYDIWWRRFKNEALYRIEEKWSDLIRDMNSILENHTSISARHCYRQNTVSSDCCLRPLTKYTVGVVFWSDDPSFRKEKPKMFLTTEGVNIPQNRMNPYDSVPKQSNADDLDWVIKVRPVDPNFGRVKGYIQCLWNAPAQDIIVPWSYGRDEVPTWLSFQGVTLTAWQGWLDQASSLWIERIQQNKTNLKMKLLMSLIYLPVLLLICVPWIIVIPAEYSPYLLGIMVMLSMIMFCFLSSLVSGKLGNNMNF
jgi:hypothetical protein